MSRKCFLGMSVSFLLAGVVLGLAPVSCTSQSSSSACRTVYNCMDDNSPICDARSLTCRSCQPTTDDVACANRNAATPRCGSSGKCVGCISNSDCKTLSAPSCGAQNTCGPCQSAADCQSHVCNSDGSCAAPADVIFVDNNNCSGSSHSGSMTDPFCSIQDAVTAASSFSKSLLSVAPSIMPYDSVSITSVPTAGLYLSSSSGAAASVQIHPSGIVNAAVTVTGTGPGKVVISGFDIAAPGSPSKSNGIACSGNADLTVLQSRIHDTSSGVTASSCTLTLDGVRLYENDVDGINLTGTNYTINNVMLWYNDAAGIVLSNSNGTLRFVTVFANGSVTASQGSGISCGAGTNAVADSIVLRNLSNSANLTDNQIVGCVVDNTVVTDDSVASTAGATKITTVDFNNTNSGDPRTFDLRLKPASASTANAACCIDKVPSSTGLIDHDIDNIHRPQGPSWDIGAAEVQSQ